MENKVYGYAVIAGADPEYFDDAADALRFGAFMECMGYDPLYYLAYIADSRVQLLERMNAAEVRRAIKF